MYSNDSLVGGINHYILNEDLIQNEEFKSMVPDNIINMTDQEFEDFIENSDNLEKALNNTLNEHEKEEHHIKQTLFRFLLETEKELEKDFKNSNYTSSTDINVDNYTEKRILESKKEYLRNIRKKAGEVDGESLKILEEKFLIEKEKEGTREFNPDLYDKLEKEIILKKKKIERLKKNSLYHKEYYNSGRGKEVRKKYNQSEKGKLAKKRRYEQ